MNDPSDSFELDEHLARLLAAYDQRVDGGDAGAATIGVPTHGPLPGERVVTPFPGGSPNVGSVGELLPGPPDDPAALPTTPPPNGSAHSHRIGRFELRRQLGKGGCGIVFLAYDPKLEREVALKIPRPEMLLSPDARRRLVREALAAAEFDHPNLVPVYETGEIGPVCYIATAFCPGQTLGEWLERQAYPVPVRQAARLVATVAEAVQHAHDRNVLHRDLKPNNVILQPTKDDPNEQEPAPGSVQLRGDHFVPRVVDFGLAKLLERGGPSETATRQILGTPKYMAPEQAQARHADIGPAADIYALGVILYELLSGRAPYEGATDVEVLRLAIEGNLTPPRHIRGDIPRDLEAICLKAMNPLPSRRYRTAIDLADDLRRFLDDKPTIARPLKWPGRAARWLRRNDQAVALAVVTTIATVLLAVGWWYVVQTRQLKDDHASVQQALAARTRTDQQRDYARGVRTAFLAWRAGDNRGAAEQIDSARRLAQMIGDATDFPHDLLARLTAADRLTIVCPAGAVTALAASADGKHLASGHEDGTIAVWNAAGDPLGSVPGGGRAVTHLVFALDGTRLISTDGTRAVAHAVSADGLLSPLGRSADDDLPGVTCLAVTPNGATVYAGDDRGRAFRIDPASHPAAARPVELSPGAPITAIAVSPAGKCVLVGTGGAVIPCDPDLKKLPGRERRWPAGVTALVCTADDGSTFVAGSADGSLARFPAGGDGPGQSRPAARVHWVAATAGGLAAGSADGYVRFGERAGHLIATGDAGAVRAAAVSRDGKTLFTGSDDGFIREWQLPDDLRVFGARAVRGVAAVAVDPDGSRVAVLTDERLTDHDGTPREVHVPIPGRAPAAVRIPKSGPAVAAYLHERSVFLREARPDARAVAFAPPDGAAVTAADLTPDADRVAAGDDRGRVFVWEAAGGKLVATFDTGQRPVRRVAFSPDGKSVAAPSPDGVGVWVLGEDKPSSAVAVDDQPVFTFLHGSDRLVTSGRSGVVRVWTLPGGREEAVLRGHVGRVTAVGVSPDGRTIVSGGATGEAKFWDYRTGQELVGLRRHSGPVTAIEFCGNGKLLVTAGGQIVLWDTRD